MLNIQRQLAEKLNKLVASLSGEELSAVKISLAAGDWSISFWTDGATEGIVLEYRGAPLSKQRHGLFDKVWEGERPISHI